MGRYTVTWITDHLGVGHAPMSYEDLDAIRDQGISAIVNLCGEYCDLHEIEEDAGFEVFYLPIPDETAPPVEEMERGLEWLDEALYLGKKVLVHCKLGVGRTGTFVTAYLLRRGFNLKKAGKLLKKAKARANPTNFSQWKTLRKFGKQEGQLKLTEPSASNNQQTTELSPLFARYQKLLELVDTALPHTATDSDQKVCPWKDNPTAQNFTLMLIEALFLSEKINVSLTSAKRQTVIDQAAGATGISPDDPEERVFLTIAQNEPACCPLLEGGSCLLYSFRPMYCRCDGEKSDQIDLPAIRQEITRLSHEIFALFFASEALCETTLPKVSIHETVSGKFIQRYFHFLISHGITTGQATP